MSSTSQPVATDELRTLQPLRRWLGAAAVAGPLLVFASSLAWVVDADRSRFVLQYYGAALVALGLVAIALWITPRSPRTGMSLPVLAVLGFGSGMGFAVDGLHGELFGSPSLADADGGVAGTLAPSLPGLLGPVALILAGIMIARTKSAPGWQAAALIAAGALFPVSRIGEIPVLAVVVDLLLVVALVPLGVRLFHGDAAEPASHG